MSLYKRNKIWWMNLRINGVRVRISTETSNRKLAEKILAKNVMEIEEGKWFGDQIRKRTLQEMIERFTKERTDCKDYYQKARDISIFKQLFRYFGERATLADVHNMVGGYEQFRQAEGKKPATIVKELSLLRRMFNVARKQWKWKCSNPVTDIELPKVRNDRVRYLSANERTRLFDVLKKSKDRWLPPMVIIAIDTGLRLSNICNLQWQEVNLPGKIITISAEKMKNDSHLGIPLTARAHDVLRELEKVKCLSGHVFHDSGRPLYPVKVQRSLRKALKLAKIDNFRFHDLRHCNASYLRQQGIDLHTISKLMGHKDTRMTNRYAHLSVDVLREAVNQLDTFWSQEEKAAIEKVI